METLIGLLISLLSIIIGAIIGYFLNVKKEKQRFINELKITTASNFISLAHESLKHLTVNISINDATKDKFELIKLTEVAGLIFKKDTYDLLDKYVGELAMSIQFYNDEQKTGTRPPNRKEIRDFKKMLNTLRSELRKECK
jgi:NADH:ubiquinone oxidoreductase subunit 2 (subunit N)